jgi:hypothetical protein
LVKAARPHSIVSSFAYNSLINENGAQWRWCKLKVRACAGVPTGCVHGAGPVGSAKAADRAVWLTGGRRTEWRDCPGGWHAVSGRAGDGDGHGAPTRPSGCDHPRAAACPLTGPAGIGTAVSGSPRQPTGSGRGGEGLEGGGMMGAGGARLGLLHAGLPIGSTSAGGQRAPRAMARGPGPSPVARLVRRELVIAFSHLLRRVALACGCDREVGKEGGAGKDAQGGVQGSRHCSWRRCLPRPVARGEGEVSLWGRGHIAVGHTGREYGVITRGVRGQII